MAFYSSGVEYGIHSLMCMVDAKGNEREMSVREMAALQGVPYDYLGKFVTRGAGYQHRRQGGWIPAGASGRADQRAGRGARHRRR